jgi:hypothetical protein
MCRYSINGQGSIIQSAFVNKITETTTLSDDNSPTAVESESGATDLTPPENSLRYIVVYLWR